MAKRNGNTKHSYDISISLIRRLSMVTSKKPISSIRTALFAQTVTIRHIPPVPRLR